MEKPKELIMFVMSMSDSMSTLFPAPIDTDPIDDKENEEALSSRWAQCSRLIEMMTSNLAGCNVDLAVAKNSDIGISVTRGNADDRYQPILTVLQNISAMCRSNGLANPEHAIREISKMNIGEYQKKKAHWFWDVETFVKFNPSVLSENLGNLTIYVVGELRTLHENQLAAKTATTRWSQVPGVKIRFLLCKADFNQLKKEIDARKKYESRKQSVQCFVSHEQFEIKLHYTATSDSPKSRLSAISVLGFLSERNLFHLTSTPLHSSSEVSEQLFHVSSGCKLSRQVLYSIGRFLLSNAKHPVVCLCQCYSDKGTHLDYGFIVASMNEYKKMRLQLIINPQVSEKIAQNELCVVDEEPSSSSIIIADQMYMPMAPNDTKLIKKRCLEMDNLPVEIKKQKFEEMVDEYKILNTDDAFLKYISLLEKKKKVE